VVARDSNNRPILHHMWVGEIEALRARCQNGRYNDFNHYGKSMKGLPTLALVREKAAAVIGNKRDPYNMPWVVDWDRMAEETLVRKIVNRVGQTEQMAMAAKVEDAADAGERIHAEGWEELEIDPADMGVPMVDGGGETREEQVAASAAIRDRKLAAAKVPASAARSAGQWNDYDECLKDFEAQRERSGYGRVLAHPWRSRICWT